MADTDTKLGIQNGSGKIELLPKLITRQPISVKLYGNGLNYGLAEYIMQHSPNTTLVLRDIGRDLDYGWEGDVKAKAKAVAERHIAMMTPFLKWAPWVSCHNEPPGWAKEFSQKQNIERAQRGNEWQVEVARLMHAAGFDKLIAYDFAVGTPGMPEFGDYDVFPLYQDGIEACEALGLHEYAMPPNMNSPLNVPSLLLRYRTAYAKMRTKRPIMLTEAAMGFDYGYRKYMSLAEYLKQLDWYDSELKKDDYLLCAHLFIVGAESGWWETWDVGQDPEYENAFVPWLRSGRVKVPAILPPVKEEKPVIDNVKAMLSAAWKSCGVTYNDQEETAFSAKAKSLGLLNGPIGNEYRRADATGRTVAGQVFFPGVILETLENDWALDHIQPFFYGTGLPWTPPLPGGIIPPPASKRLTTADMPAGFQWVIDPFTPAPGQKYWVWTQIGGVKLGQGTQVVITLVALNGQVSRGTPVTHAWDIGRAKSETFMTNGNGVVTIVEGSGSDYTPGDKPPPDRLYVSKGDGADGVVWPTPVGDVLHYGEVGGHLEFYGTQEERQG